MHFLYYVEVPLSKIGFEYRELTNKEQFALSKADISLPFNNKKSALKYLNLFHSIFFEVIKNKEDLFKINLIDYFLLICKIRETTLNENFELIVSSHNKEEDENIKITYRLKVFMENLYNVTKNLNQKFSSDNLEIEIDWPSFSSENYFLEKSFNENHQDFLLDSLCEYVKVITIKNKTINFWEMNREQRLKLYDSLPAKIHNKIEKSVLPHIKDLFEANLFNLGKPEYGKFNFYSSSYQKFLRLFFAENLQSLYQDYFVLMTKKIDINYINNCSVAEKRIFISFIEEQMEGNNQSSMDDLTEEMPGGFESSKNSVDF